MQKSMQCSRAPLLLFFDRMTDNELIVEYQSLLSIAFYEHMSTESMKVTEMCDKMHTQLFSNSQRMGFVEQFSKGDSHFANLFEQVPIESHGLENNNVVACRLRLKPMLTGYDNTFCCIDEKFSIDKLCNSTLARATKIAPKQLCCNHLKVPERNIKKKPVSFSPLLKGKLEHVPVTENESGITYKDYFVPSRESTTLDMPKTDN